MMEDEGGAAKPAEEASSKAKPEESIWSRIQASGILIPPEVIDKLAELDLELSEGEWSTWLHSHMMQKMNR